MISFGTMSFSRVDGIERRIFCYLCVLSISLPLSKAVANIFLVLAILGFIHRLIRKHDDVAPVFRRYKDIFAVTAILMAAILLSAIFSGDIIFGLRTFVEKYILHISIMLPIAFLNYGRDRVLLLTKLLLTSIFVSNLTIIFHALPNLSEETWRFRGVLGLMPHGSLLSISLPIFILLLIHVRGGRLKLLFLLAAILEFMAISFNGTRGAWLAVAILIPMVIMIQARSKLKSVIRVLAILIAVGGIFLLTPQLSSRVATIIDMDVRSNSERFMMWQSAFDMFKDYPLLGVGYGQYKEAYRTQYILPEARERQLEHAHSNVMQMLGECGIVGLAAFLLMWGYFTCFSLSGWFRERDVSFLIFFCVLWGLMLHGLTEFNFQTASVSKIFWYSLGLLIAYRRTFQSSSSVT